MRSTEIRAFQAFCTSLRRVAKRGAIAVTAFSLATAVLAPTIASADVPDPTVDGEVVAVLPVLMASADAGWTELGARLHYDGVAQKEHTGTLAKAPMAAIDGNQGFSFAGKATDADVKVLKYGYMLGLLPARIAADRTADAQASAKHLAEASAVLDALSPEARTAVQTVLDAAAQGRIAGNGFTAVLEAANAGMSSDTPRAYGYLMTGVWAGLAAYAAVKNVESASFIGMAEPIAVLLDEDADFGSTDRALAKTLRSIATELQSPRADVASVLELGNTLLGAKADGAKKG